MAVPEPLPPVPTRLIEPNGRLASGLYAGDVHDDPVEVGPTRGRVRRWCYVAAGDADTVVGAAVVDLGFAAAAFAFVAVGGRSATYDTKRPLGRGAVVGGVPSGVAALSTRRGAITLGGDGSMTIDVPTGAGRLRADVTAADAVTPAVCVTPTAGGGWNVTRKASGTPVRGQVRLGDGATVDLADDAGGWSDWTAGRQDRTTTWLWAAGAGVTAGGNRVGLNASTGMNEAAGEDVLWWDGTPHRIDVSQLRPVDDDPCGAWRVTGPGLRLRLTPSGLRAASERLLIVRSEYVQPFGRWSGTVDGPDGTNHDVRLAGVAEEHLAVW